MTKNWKSLQEKIHFLIKLQFAYPHRLPERTSATGGAWRPQRVKREHPALQNMTFQNFFSVLVGHSCPSESGSGNRIRIHWPDWIRIRNAVLVIQFLLNYLHSAVLPWESLAPVLHSCIRIRIIPDSPQCLLFRWKGEPLKSSQPEESRGGEPAKEETQALEVQMAAGHPLRR